MLKMSARKRKTLVVCRQCHEKIQYGRYDGEPLRRKNYWKATSHGRVMRSLEGGGWKRTDASNSLAAYPTARPDLNERCPG